MTTLVVVLTCPVRLVQDLRVPDGCEYEDDTPEPTVDAAERSLRHRLGPDATLDRYVSTRARVESATQGLDAEYAEVPMAPAVVPVLPLDSGRLPAAAGEAVVAGRRARLRGGKTQHTALQGQRAEQPRNGQLPNDQPGREVCLLPRAGCGKPE